MKQEKGTWILLSGNPPESEAQGLPPSYIDHAGFLASKMGIACIPAKVSQKDKKLLIKEIPC